MWAKAHERKGPDNNPSLKAGVSETVENWALAP